MYKRKLDLTIYVPDGKYCNVGPKEQCRFCVKHCNGYTCAISQQQLHVDGKYVIKTEECMWPNPMPVRYAEPDIKLTPKDIVNETVDHFVRAFTALRRGGLNEEMSISLAKKKIKEGD